ncbi:hypothetical protein [Burkholderia multivorans]|uniref:hypothetical protein n=1 Tax=Burkholderia multivorans TaxID=87883 RepID=UPI0015928142|nr:hypothetical protein [Burkholderia multivorans]
MNIKFTWTGPTTLVATLEENTHYSYAIANAVNEVFMTLAPKYADGDLRMTRECGDAITWKELDDSNMQVAAEFKYESDANYVKDRLPETVSVERRSGEVTVDTVVILSLIEQTIDDLRLDAYCIDSVRRQSRKEYP